MQNPWHGETTSALLIQSEGVYWLAEKWTMNQHTRSLGNWMPLRTCSWAWSVEAFVRAKIARALAAFSGKGSLSAPDSFQSWTSCQLQHVTLHIQLIQKHLQHAMIHLTLHIMSFLCFSIIHMEKCTGATKFQLECQGSESKSKFQIHTDYFLIYLLHEKQLIVLPENTHRISL